MNLIPSNKSVYDNNKEYFFVTPYSFTYIIKLLKPLESGFASVNRADNLRSFVKSYRERLLMVNPQTNLDDTEFHFNDGTVFYYDSGRLSKSLEKQPGINRGSYFYNYDSELLREDVASMFPHPVDMVFFDFEYGASMIEIESNMEQVNIFGKRRPFNKNNGASASLRDAVNEIERIAMANPAVRNWIASLKIVSTYSPRNVAASSGRSLHTYGIAVDFIGDPEKSGYWLWLSYFYPDWWNKRDKFTAVIPSEVVRTFEKHGFVWGGKWFQLDTMHFEYRPEIAGKIIK